MNVKLVMCMYRMIYPSDDCFGCMSTLGNKIIMDSLNMQMFHDTPVPSIIHTVISILHCEGPYVRKINRNILTTKLFICGF